MQTFPALVEVLPVLSYLSDAICTFRKKSNLLSAVIPAISVYINFRCFSQSVRSALISLIANSFLSD